MSELTYDEFFQDFHARVYAGAGVDGDFMRENFVQFFLESLSDQGEIESADVCYYRSRGMQLDAYGFSDDEHVLYVIVSDYDGGDDPYKSLTATNVKSVLKRAENFLDKVTDADFCSGLEESSAVFGAAYEIIQRSKKLKRVKFFLVSEGRLSDRVVELPSTSLGSLKCSYQVWDMGRLYRLALSGREREDLEINVADWGLDGIPCLPANLETEIYEAYLMALPGDFLRDIYDEYGQRLLEQNVRTFLQFRGGVNKGIKETLATNPEMFFAYNNGITATAESVRTEMRAGAIIAKSITNLQIVNGAQTTAAIALSAGLPGVDLSQVVVPMKLSVVDALTAEKIVPRISEYANTQNKVSAADFFSNHPFHVRLKEQSVRNYAPSPEGLQRMTRWFYERTRGEYVNEPSRMSPSDKKKFLQVHPRNQVIIKTDVAKFETTWDCSPHIVSLGAQKCFAKFSTEVSEKWDKNSERFGDFYFKKLVGKAILFRSTEKIVSGEDWYAGGYRANIVTYTLALLSSEITKLRKEYDFEGLWRRQAMSHEDELQIKKLSKWIHGFITKTPSKYSNVTEWCKREDCWVGALATYAKKGRGLDSRFSDTLVSRQKVAQAEQESIRKNKLDAEIKAQETVVRLCEKGIWREARKFGDKRKILTSRDREMIARAMRFPDHKPSVRDSDYLLKLVQKLRKQGFTPK